jgi:hypothetical protein
VTASILRVGVRTEPQKQLYHGQVALARRKVQQSTASLTFSYQPRIIT